MTTPYYDQHGATLYVGDVLDVLKTLPDGCVQTCVTSPPYWGLRDYGTGQWEGGDAGCDHLAPLTGGKGGKERTGGNWSADGQYRATCGKCGARRIDQQLGLEPTPDCGHREMITLRDDLTDEERAFVIGRLQSLGLL